MNLDKLKQYVIKMPDLPGIYKFQDAKSQELYIGKASSLKKRLLSYLKTTDSRIRQMITVADHLTHLETNSDIEALILESQLIKQKRPKFNIVLRDDKQYGFVGFTNDAFSRIFITHQPHATEKYGLGPRPGEPVPSVPPLRGSPSTTGSKAIPSAAYVGPFTDMGALKSTLKYLRTIFPYCTCKQKHHNFCLNYHIGKCVGICCLRQPDANSNFQFSIFKYKQNIKAIKDILSGKKNNLVKELKRQMAQAGKDHDFDRAIELRNKLERLERVFYNAQVINNSEILKSYNSGLQKLLKSSRPIIRIEGYDISNIQGKHATGSMVTFVTGQPDKTYYRKFNIKAVRGANDTAMVREILERRFNHLEWPFPDLILIDGGKGQLSAAEAAISSFQPACRTGRFPISKKILIISMTKNDKHQGEKIYISGRKQPVLLSKLSESDRNLLLAINAEAHRFTISYYRHLHRKMLQ